MSKKPRILVLGATGQVGGAVVSLLATDKSVDVIAAARNVDKAKALGVDSAYLDLDKIEPSVRLLKTSTAFSWQPGTRWTCSAKAKIW